MILMNNVANKNASLEILVSTKDQKNDAFIHKMFKNCPDFKHSVLIINQSKNKLNIDRDNFTVINSDGTGLSKSRNLAINNAKSDLCLFSDDDIIYEPNFDSIVVEAFNLFTDADIITFQMNDFQGNLFKKYPKTYLHNKKSISTVNSVVIAFRRYSIKSKYILFDTKFGLGSVFETADEYVFLRNALDKKLKIYNCPKVILSHKPISSGQAVGKDKIIFARAAIFYKYYGSLSYIKLFHHILSLLNINAISFSEVFLKYKIGLRGIKKYKSIS